MGHIHSEHFGSVNDMMILRKPINFLEIDQDMLDLARNDGRPTKNSTKKLILPKEIEVELPCNSSSSSVCLQSKH